MNQTQKKQAWIFPKPTEMPRTKFIFKIVSVWIFTAFLYFALARSGDIKSCGMAAATLEAQMLICMTSFENFD